MLLSNCWSCQDAVRTMQRTVFNVLFRTAEDPLFPTKEDPPLRTEEDPLLRKEDKIFVSNKGGSSSSSSSDGRGLRCRPTVVVDVVVVASSLSSPNIKC